MNTNNIPKRKKEHESSGLKRVQSEEIFNKTTKRKAPKKNLSSTTVSKTTFMLTSSMSKINKPTKKQKSKKDDSVKKMNHLLKQNKQSRQHSAKTTKKSAKKKKEKQEKQEQLTERKKIHLQYFMYKDTYVPIENTQQRKIIYKIQLIDEKTLKSNQNILKRSVKLISKSTQVEKVQLVDKGIQPTDRKQYRTDFQCQTESENRSTYQFDEPEEEKCFAETLSELQFLYLPDEKNFEGFSRTQKAHYKQLLLYIAKKFEEDPLLDQQSIQLFLQQRELKQRGHIQSFPKRGFPTHTPSIISYLSNLFCYIEIHEKSSLIERINCSYGYSLTEKLSRVRSEKTTKMSAPLLPDSTFWRFQNELHDGLNFESETIEQTLHYHNKAVFDAVNQILLEFQPYYGSRGEPFPWSYNFQTTFYCITEQSFGALAFQVKEKISEISSVLAGIMLQNENEQKYKAHVNKILLNEKKMMLMESKKYDQKVGIDERKTFILCNIAEWIGEELIKQFTQFFQPSTTFQSLYLC